MTDQEREIYIKQCGLMVELSMALACRDMACHWVNEQVKAIGRRTPGQIAKMTAAIDQAINEGNDYFAWRGAQDAKQILRAA